MGKEIIFTIVAMVFTSVNLLAQEWSDFEILWEKAYGGVKNEMPQAVVPTKKGVLIVGSKQPENRFDFDLMLMEINGEGEVVWEKTIGGEGMENGFDALVLGDGEILVLGQGDVGGKKSDILLFKFDKERELLWKKNYGGIMSEFPESLILDKNGNILITGTRQLLNPESKEITNAFVMKLDREGNEIWTRDYSSSGFDSLEESKFMNEEGEGSNTIIQTKDGGYLIGGYTATKAKKGVATDGWICKLDNDGNKIWDRSFGAIGGDHVASVWENENGNYFVTGTRYSKPAPFQVSLWFLEFNSDGEMLNEKYFNEGNECTGGKSMKMSDGFVIVGSTDNSDKEWKKLEGLPEKEKESLLKKGWELIDFNGEQYLENDNAKTGLRKIDKDNFLIWVNGDGEVRAKNSFGGKKDEKLMNLCQAWDGVYLVGYSYSKGAGLKDVYVLKVRPE